MINYLRNEWYKISIKQKITIILLSMIVAFVTPNIYNISQSYTEISSLNNSLSYYYQINQFTLSIANNEILLRNLVDHPTNEKYKAYIENMNQMIRESESVKPQSNFWIDETDIDIYLLSNAIQNVFETYIEQINYILNTIGEESSVVEYYEVVRIGDYLEMYSKELLQSSLYNGSKYYQKILAKQKRMRTVFMCWLLVAGTIVGLFAMLVVRQIVRPLVKLSKGAIDIAYNNLDIEDIHIPNKDEIGELAEAFNKMKASIKKAIYMEQEKNQIQEQCHKQELEIINTQRLLGESKLLILQSQINPHFLFNTLNIISRTARIEKAVQTEELIIGLARLFRYNLETNNKTVTLARELAIINEYMKIQGHRFGDRIKFITDIHEKIELEKIQIPTFTLQPLIENCIIHGMKEKISGGIIHIKIFHKKNRTTILIEDNGSGIEKERLKHIGRCTKEEGHITGIGISNIKARLEMIYKESTFKVLSKIGEGTRIEITL